MLLTRMKLDDGIRWLLLDKLEQHEYEQSPFLEPAYLKRFIAQEGAAIREQIDLLPNESGSSSSSSASAQDLKPIELEYFNEQFIELNAEQSKAVRAALPLVVMGMPGSGKTCVAASMITNANAEEPPNQPILYVTSSKQLVEKMKEMHDKMTGAEQAHAVTVEHKTFVELLQGRDEAPKGYRYLHGDAMTKFATWCDGCLKSNPSLKEQLLKQLNNKPQGLNATLYQEFRMMSGYSESEYKARSYREKLFYSESPASSSSAATAEDTGHDICSELYKALARYRAHLKHNQLIDTAFLNGTPKRVTQKSLSMKRRIFQPSN